VKLLAHLFWVAVAGAAAFCLGAIALNRGEQSTASGWCLAAACSYATGYRFYSKFLAARVWRSTTGAPLPPSGCATATISSRPISGSSSATTSPPSPDRARWWGPVLAAQFGYLPGTLWIIIGAVLGGAVQDFVILFALHAP